MLVPPMKKIFLLFVLLFSGFITYSCSDDDNNNSTAPDYSKLKIYTENYQPYNYEENGQIAGISAEIVQRILQELNIDKDIVIKDWSESYNELLAGEDVVLFTTILNADRVDKMKWAGPVCSVTSYFYIKSGSDIKISTLGDAKALNSIGVVSGYAYADDLENNGFSNIVFAEGIDELAAKLMTGEVDAIVESPYALRSAMNSSGYDYDSDVEKEFLFDEQQGYIAFSLNISDDVVNAWQQKIDQLRNQGTIQELYNKYMDGETAPAAIQIYTEENPPQSYKENDGSISGSSTDIMNEILDRTNMDVEINLADWSNALSKLKFTPNMALFSTARTVEREDLFHWIGPICRKHYQFFTLTSSGIDLNDLEDAKGLGTVATMTGWATVTMLEDEGFDNIVTLPTVHEVFAKLMAGEVDAIVINDIALKSICDNYGCLVNEITAGPKLSETLTYIALSKGSDNEYILKWTDAYNEMKQDGTLQQIIDEWYPGLNMEL